jgi:hypothetical protein
MLARHMDLNINMKANKQALKINLAGRDAKMAGLQKFVSVGGVTKALQGEIKLSEIRELVPAGEEAFVRIAVKDRMNKEIATATYKIDHVGTDKEVVGTENIEEKWLEGHLDGAHADDSDITRGH